MSDADVFRTLSGRGRAHFDVRGSEFIGHAAPVDGREEAEAFVADVEAEYDDATHNVPAYRVRVDSGPSGYLLREYQNDDGEPTGSAGKPALNVLERKELENVVAVVTRYYGGTNLGVGGLARAYARAVNEAVEDAGVETRRPRERFAVEVEYDDSGTVRSILESADASFEAEYETTVRFTVTTDVDEASTVRDRIRSATSGRAIID